MELVVLICRDDQHTDARSSATARDIPIVLLRADSSLKEAVAALQGKPPADLSAIGGDLRTELATRLRNLEVGPPGDCYQLIEGDRLIGDSPEIQEIKSYIERVASTDSNVLITGETGTGKELIAELIQKNSKRRLNRFICINCAAIPDSLLESELFGYERGAFTGAQTAREGKLEAAHGGTVFFDEIGDMSPYAQAKILRLIESKEIQPLGGRRTKRIDFRIIAATNQDLDSAACAERFRRDLYFRLSVARIHVPSLRERKADLPVLFDHFIRHFNQQFGRTIERMAEHALQDLLQYEWPGNVRELKNMMEAMFVNLPAGKVTQLDLPERLRRQIKGATGVTPSEQERMLSVLWSTDWNKSKTARQLHWSRMTLYRKMAKYRLERGEHRRKPLQRADSEGERRPGGKAATDSEY